MPQTQTRITELLSAAGLSPQKRHGQHFLIDLNLLRLLVETADVRPGDVVLEVGPGTGSLTELLARAVGPTGHVVAVEIDSRIMPVAQRQLAALAAAEPGAVGMPHWINADILRGKNRLNPQVVGPLVELCSGRRLVVVANLPYGAGTPVIANALTDGLPVEGLWVTVQREVADRLAAMPGTKDYGPLTVTVQSLADVRVFRRVPASAFWPRPEVESAMVEVLARPQRRALYADYAVFDQIVEGAFTQRRKGMRSAVRAIRNPALAGCDWPSLLAEAGIAESQRPDQVSVPQWRNLSNLAAGVLAAKGLA